MSSGYDVTVTFRVDGAESLPDALHHIGLQRIPGQGPKSLRAPFSAPQVKILNVFPIRWSIRSLKEEHKP
jgi:hypothetical protein